MYCYICGGLCDYREAGLCLGCEKMLLENNQKVRYISLLEEAVTRIPQKYYNLHNRIADTLYI